MLGVGRWMWADEGVGAAGILGSGSCVPHTCMSWPREQTSPPGEGAGREKAHLSDLRHLQDSEFFKQFDLDNDGRVSFDEVRGSREFGGGGVESRRARWCPRRGARGRVNCPMGTMASNGAGPACTGQLWASLMGLIRLHGVRACCIGHFSTLAMPTGLGWAGLIWAGLG